MVDDSWRDSFLVDSSDEGFLKMSANAAKIILL